MKKAYKLIIMLVVAISMIGCANDNSEKEQKEAVNKYFTYLEKRDEKKLKKLFDKKLKDEFKTKEFMTGMENAEDSMVENIQDAMLEGDGEEIEKECQSFINYIYKSIIKEYKIGEIKEDKEEVHIEVTGKYLNFEEFNTEESEYQMDEQKLEDIVNDYVNGEIEEDEYKKAFNKVFSEEVKEYFDSLKSLVKELDTEKFKMTFTLVEKDEGWIIKEIESETGIGGINNKSAEEKEEIETYKVEEEKVKAENTLLKKGRLEDGINNQKYIETPFEFIDYNITNGLGVEIAEYDTINYLDGKLTLDVEVAGNIGDSYVIVIRDADYNVIYEEEVTLKEEHEIKTVEFTGFDVSTECMDMTLYVGNTYIDGYGESFGQVFIWGES